MFFSANIYFQLGKENENGMTQILNFEEALNKNFTENMNTNIKERLPMGVIEENGNYYCVGWGGYLPYSGLKGFENIEISSYKITANVILKFTDMDDKNLPDKSEKIIIVKKDNKWLVESFNLKVFLTEETESESFDENQEKVKEAFQEYLNLVGARAASPSAILMELNIITEESSESARKEGFLKTNVKYSNFKEKILSYMTENCYEKEFGGAFIEEDGYLCYMNGGATGVNYKVKNVVLKDNGNVYNGEVVRTEVEYIEEVNFEFGIQYNGDKIIIDYCI